MSPSTELVLKISQIFSRTPGARVRTEGRFSGQELREDVLVPSILKAIETHQTILIDLDGTAGYGTSFLEEAFGGLIRVNKYDLKTLNLIIKFTSNEEPYLINEINKYMKDVADAKH